MSLRRSTTIAPTLSQAMANRQSPVSMREAFCVVMTEVAEKCTRQRAGVCGDNGSNDYWQEVGFIGVAWMLRAIMKCVGLREGVGARYLDEKLQNAADIHVRLKARKQHDRCTQTPPSPVTYESVTDPLPQRACAEAAAQTQTPAPADIDEGKGKAKTRAVQAAAPDTLPAATALTQESRQPSPERPLTQRPSRAPTAPVTPARAIVLHGAPTKCKPGQMRRWNEEDN